MTPAESTPHRYRQQAITAYARALDIDPAEISHTTRAQILQSLLGHAHTDEQAADQAGLTLEQLHHDCTTLSATDSLPMIIVSPSPDAPGFFYFSRPLRGWPHPHT